MSSLKKATCPCGDEPIDSVQGRGVLGSECAGAVVRNVRWWLGRRYPDEIEDFVQDVYLKLVAPKGLETFIPPAQDVGEAFRAWLYGVVRFYALYTIQMRRRRAHIAPGKTDVLPEPTDRAQAFARACIADMVTKAIECVSVDWEARKEQGRERFDVFLPFVLEADINYARARSRLGISYELAKKLRYDLKEEVCFAVRTQVRDSLALEPGSDAETIERRIDDEICDLFEQAFPDNCVWDFFFPSPDSNDDPEPKP
jgi:DNA-directed RNA polymerase specialized sigma24 family protein